MSDDLVRKLIWAYPGRQSIKHRVTRWEIYGRDDWVCFYCSLVVDVDEASLDHLIPRVRKGPNSAGNLVTACVSCNHRKNDVVWEEGVLAEVFEIVDLRNSAAGLSFGTQVKL